MRRRGPRRPLLLAAVVLGLGAALAPAGRVAPFGPPPAVAATRDEVSTGATTYTVDTAGGAVHVAVAMTVEDVRPDTTSTTYFLTGYRLALQPEATHLRVTHGGTVLATTQVAQAGYLAVAVSFPARVGHGHSQAFQVTYDLPDGGPRTSGPIRVAPGVAAFYAWAYGDDRASVRIVLPGDCDPTTRGDPLQRGTVDGQVVLTAAAITDRSTWAATVSATCAHGLSVTTQVVPLDGGGAATLDVHAFPDDPTWAADVTGDLTRGLPVLAGLVGLPWPVAGPLEVTEAYAPSLVGYAGFYEPPLAAGAAARIRISESATPLVILHEAAHAWFNDALFRERWIEEGLANEFASLALARLGEPAPAPGQVRPAQADAFALETWAAPTAIITPATRVTEAYGYDASWTVIGLLVGEIGPQRMQAVLQAAAARQIPYVGRPTPETLPAATGGLDWRVFLDLVEQVGGADDADDLFSTWVVPPAEDGLLASHTAATGRYETLLAAGDGWLPGDGVRGPLAAWDFGLATTRETEALAVLATRDQLDQEAAALRLTPPPGLRALYEGATGDLATVQARADDDLATVRALADGHAAVAADHDPFVVVGLVGSTPQEALDAADRAFSAGDQATARADVALAVATIATAGPIGQQRVTVGLFLLASVALLLAVIERRQRRRRRSVAAALAVADTLAADRMPPATPPAGPPHRGEGPPP